jgi:hypothetical protein
VGPGLLAEPGEAGRPERAEADAEERARGQELQVCPGQALAGVCDRQYDPSRSPSMPAGIETIRIATLALASSTPDWSGESANRWAKAGTSGTIALHIASPTNTAQ